MNVSRTNFVPQNANLAYGNFQARPAQSSGNVSEGGFGGAFAAEMSLANDDLHSAWNGLGAQVLPHFGHAPRF